MQDTFLKDFEYVEMYLRRIYSSTPLYLCIAYTFLLPLTPTYICSLATKRSSGDITALYGKVASRAAAVSRIRAQGSYLICF